MNPATSSKTLIVCVSCLVAGALLGFGVGRGTGGARGESASSGGVKNNAQASVSGRANRLIAGNNGAAAMSLDEIFPDLANVKSPEACRAYLARWLAAECPRKSAQAARECLRRWAEADADGALAFVHQSPKFPQRNDAYAITLAPMAKSAAPRAIEWLQRNLSEEQRGDVAENIIGKILADSPKQAMELAVADAIPVNGYIFQQIMASMANVSIADAQKMFAGLPPNEKSAAATGLVFALAKADPNAAYEWCAAQKGTPYAEGVMRAFLQNIAGDNPKLLLGFVERNGGLGDDAAAYSLMNRVVQSDPVVAMELLQKLPLQNRENCGYQIVRALFQSDADQAIAAAQTLLSPNVQSEVIYGSYDNWLRSDRKGAEAWLEKEADGSVREQIKSRLMAQSAPETFLASVGDSVAPNVSQDGLGNFASQCVSIAVRNLGYEKPSAAMQWLVDHPNQITAERLYSVRTDDGSMPPVSISSIGNMPEGNGRDVMLNYVTDQCLARNDWTQAAAALDVMSDVGSRDALRFQIYSRMMNAARDTTGKAAAQQWLDAQPLSDEVRASWELLAKNQRQPIYIPSRGCLVD